MIYVSDTETTVFTGQTSTEVWLTGILSLDYKEEIIVKSIEELIFVISTLENNSIIYFHNLKFDGSFIIDYLLNNGWKFGIVTSKNTRKLKKKKELHKKEFTCFISRKGQWYNIVMCFGNKKTVTIRDSVKLLPFSLDKLGKFLKTNHKKLTMQYKGERSAGGHVSKKELEYFKSDLYVLAESLNAVKKYGIEGTTIGRSCLQEFKKMHGRIEYRDDFPNLYECEIDENLFGSKNVGMYVRKSYSGAFVYVNPEKQGKIIKNGFTLDVTSLYPSRMHSSSGCIYPFGYPKICKGKAELEDSKYFFQRILVKFKIKKGFLPFIKIRNSYLHNPKECLTQSKVFTKDGIIDEKIELTLCQTELFLFLEHYEIIEIDYLDYCVFYARSGIFDEYIDKWKKIKDENSENPVLRFIAKLKLNNLYGKFASSILSSFKVPFINENSLLRFTEQYEEDSIPGYIPVGSAIIAEARVFQIRSCQKNYYQGGNGFCYSDTDSIHFEGTIEEVNGIEITENELNTYKLEEYWHTAIFAGVKRYIEISGEKMNITCAGMPDRCKDVFLCACGYKKAYEMNREVTEEEYYYIREKKRVEDFKKGLIVPGKLQTVRYPGGIVLEEGRFTFR